MIKIVFLGPPGGGKGSQAQRIAPALGIPHISTGEMLRAAIANQTPVGLGAKQLIDLGELVPDEMILELVQERIEQKDCENGYLLDGFPRTLPQAKAFDILQKPTHVFNIDVPKEEILKRLTGRRVCTDGHTTHLNQMQDDACPYCGKSVLQRKDDLPETVNNRLKVYHEQTAPLVDHYRSQGILHDIDGTVSIEETQQAILAVLS